MVSETVTDILDSMNPDQLIELKTLINQRLEDVKADKIKQLSDEMKQWGISSSDLNGHAKDVKPHGKLPMKYQNPDDATQQWSGKGKPPNWFKACLENGMSRTDLEIV
jgi:DNA-binding protein H-NS